MTQYSHHNRTNSQPNPNSLKARAAAEFSLYMFGKKLVEQDDYASYRLDGWFEAIQHYIVQKHKLPLAQVASMNTEALLDILGADITE
ncbi:hypothetical protein J8Z24_18290 [Pseudoalteromonas sp. SCSIO 43201]|uniref:hypothetical protein n=1 Tax=Pseudoalteromonas sp. SCSIO 43201 TaxID=2822842 RepID=UPI002075D7FB|nr:hypothetical protein [Pseudoalteromonas sp. SCSIO 43201]USD30911.1 hypothetical protein J8Z24_18290 [Pseudoalteromonas sp. SCSIO 43201]